MSNGYLEDVPDINEDTVPGDLIEFTKRRANDPIEIDETTIYNFNSHKPDYEKLEEAVNGKLKREEYIIPLQVTGAWTFIVHLLPENIREAEILIYRENIEEYYAYQNYTRIVPDELITTVKQDIAQNRYNKR